MKLYLNHLLTLAPLLMAHEALGVRGLAGKGGVAGKGGGGDGGAHTPPDGGDTKGSPPDGKGGPPAGVELVNHLSVPVIYTEAIRVGPTNERYDGTFAVVTDPANQCAGEDIIDGVVIVEDHHVCYHDGSNIWWLQKEPLNTWKAEEIDHTGSMLEVSAVDSGDLLGGAEPIKAKQVRIEFNLLQDTGGIPTLWAFPMIVVPGNEGMVEEQGTKAFVGRNLNPNADLVLVDSYEVFPTDEGVPLNALVYTTCGYLYIDQIEDASGATINRNVLNSIHLPTEVTVSGKITYGYVWNRKAEPAGKYRIKFLIEGDGCNAMITSNTVMVNEKGNPMTLITNEANGGAYIDIVLASTGVRRHGLRH